MLRCDRRYLLLQVTNLCEKLEAGNIYGTSRALDVWAEQLLETIGLKTLELRMRNRLMSRLGSQLQS